MPSMSRAPAKLLACYWVMTSIVGCPSGELAEIAVDLRTDYEAPADFDALEVSVDGEVEVTALAEPASYLGGRRVADISGVALGLRTVEVRLISRGEAIATRSVLVQVEADRALTVVIARSCADRTCPGPGDDPSATECDFTGCVPPDLIPDDTGAPDLGGVDLGVIDQGAPLDGGACADPCAEESCNDHGFCLSGVCVCDVGWGGTSCTTCTDGWESVFGASPPSCVPPNLIDGTAAADLTLDGTPGADNIRGLDGPDNIRGLDGPDRVNGNTGSDTLNGNAGRDEVLGGANDDVVQGGSEDDVLFGGDGNDQVIGGEGDDRLVGDLGNDQLEGGAGNDRYTLDGLGDDVIDDSGGSDIARCRPGISLTNNASAGADRILRFSTGGSVRIVGDRVEQILCCP